MRSADGTRSPLGPVLLGTETAIMVGLLFYALLVMDPPIDYVVAVLAAAGATGWAALECLFSDWADRGRNGHLHRRPTPSPPQTPAGPTQGPVERGDPVHPLADPIRALDADALDPRVHESVPSFFRRPPTHIERPRGRSRT